MVGWREQEGKVVRERYKIFTNGAFISVVHT